MEERIKAIIRSSGWSDYKVEPVEANTFEEKLSVRNFMWQIAKNGGSLFIKEVSGQVESGAVSIVSQYPEVLEPEKIPYKYPVIIGVGQAPFDRVFNVFIEREFLSGGDEKFDLIYFTSDLEYVNDNIEKILRRVVKPEYYSEKITTERRCNDGRVMTRTDIVFPTINQE